MLLSADKDVENRIYLKIRLNEIPYFVQINEERIKNYLKYCNFMFMKHLTNRRKIKNIEKNSDKVLIFSFKE